MTTSCGKKRYMLREALNQKSENIFLHQIWCPQHLWSNLTDGHNRMPIEHDIWVVFTESLVLNAWRYIAIMLFFLFLPNLNEFPPGLWWPRNRYCGSRSRPSRRSWAQWKRPMSISMRNTNRSPLPGYRTTTDTAWGYSRTTNGISWFEFKATLCTILTLFKYLFIRQLVLVPPLQQFEWHIITWRADEPKAWPLGTVWSSNTNWHLLKLPIRHWKFFRRFCVPFS